MLNFCRYRLAGYGGTKFRGESVLVVGRWESGAEIK